MLVMQKLNGASPCLQPPGAGLPLIESLIVRYWLMPRATKQNTWQSNAERLERESALMKSGVIELTHGRVPQS